MEGLKTDAGAPLCVRAPCRAAANLLRSTVPRGIVRAVKQKNGEGQNDGMKKALPWIFAALLFLLLAVVGYSQRGRLLSFFYTNQSQAAAQEGQQERAALALEKELALYSEDTALRLRVVDAFLAYGNFARAEYHLMHGLRERPGQTALYRKLSAVYVQQNKLLDAVELLDGITNPLVLQELTDRPAPPEPNPPPGVFHEIISVALAVPGGARCYTSARGEIPSTEGDLYVLPLPLSAGATIVRAVSVSEEGLVSSWWEGSYLLEDIREPVVFADSAVEALTRGLLAQPEGDIYTDQLWGIAEVVSEEPLAYKTLEDFRVFTGLESLCLVGQDEECDLSALVDLTSLKRLALRNFHIDMMGLDPIGGLAGLTELDLSENRIATLTPLAGLTELRRLSLRDNSIIDLTPLSELALLEHLDLSQNAVENVQPLGKLTALRELRLSENRIPGLYGLQTLSALQVLDLSYNVLAELTHIGGLTALKELYIGRNRLETLEPLLPLAGLEILHVPGNLVAGLEGLQRMTALRELNASENLLVSLAGIEPCVSLETANFNRNQLSALSQMIGLSRLKILLVEHNQLTTLKAALEFPAIERIDAFGNSLTDRLDMFADKTVVINRG